MRIPAFPESGVFFFFFFNYMTNLDPKVFNLVGGLVECLLKLWELFM